ncbi:virion protein [Roseobacter phage RD-1410W1-01]|uniref:Virion protein n=1 Tax=Roseobacter phage RD-1410W1-01 TaxID=1815984 RepID=A0A191VYF5_9CAUD|nr:virion protein [Roseobacter phage RD-1410W1-01]ANJ20740.1 virion protein [Roseobacter phage RD-1410W1-01]
MPNILFASNSVSHFPGSLIGSPSWSWDDSRVPYSIHTLSLNPVSSPMFKGSETNETWVHFRMGANSWYVNNNENICEITDAEGNKLIGLSYHNRTSEGYHTYLTADGTQYSSVRYIPMRISHVRTYDIRILHNSLIARVEVYVNEILIDTIERNINDQMNVPRFLVLGGGYGNSGDMDSYYSEIIVADGDTRNARLDLIRPVATGVYGNWLGAVTTLADDDPTTGMTTVLPDQKQSTILSPYGGAQNISNIVQVTTSVRGINSPDQLDHFIRMSGVDYAFPERYDIPFEKTYQVSDWRLNPATSQPWEGSELTNIEFGFESKQSS